MNKRIICPPKKTIQSKYKIFGGFGLLIAIEMMLVVFMIFLFYSFGTLEGNAISFTNNAGSVFLFLGTVFLIFLLVIGTECRRLVLDEEGIAFINPFLPFLKYKIKWDYFDYFITTEEHNEYDSNNAIWFIKNEKIKKRISSFYYANYYDILNSIKTKDNGTKEYNIFYQFFAMLRLVKIK